MSSLPLATPSLAPLTATQPSENLSQTSQLHHRDSDEATVPPPALSTSIITTAAPDSTARASAHKHKRKRKHRAPQVAGPIAGGDYDGDMGALIFDPEIVRHFLDQAAQVENGDYKGDMSGGDMFRLLHCGSQITPADPDPDSNFSLAIITQPSSGRQGSGSSSSPTGNYDITPDA